MKNLSLFDDACLAPYRAEMEARSRRAFARAEDLTGGKTLADWANSHHYFGLHRTERGWVFREWAPNANVTLKTISIPNRSQFLAGE